MSDLLNRYQLSVAWVLYIVYVAFVFWFVGRGR